MTFTYDNTLSTDLAVTRFNLSDISSGDGPYPDKTNFPDETINALLTSEGSTTGATAACFEALSTAWASYALSEKGVNDAFDGKGVSKIFKVLADDWRAKAGGGARAPSSGVMRGDWQQTNYTTDL